MEEDGEDEQVQALGLAAIADTQSIEALAEQTAKPVPPFLRTIVDQLRVLSAGGGGGGGQFAALPSLASTSGSAVVNWSQSADSRPYPFDKAVNSLFVYSVEMLELSQRGVRNPPVFDHEDSRNLPSGTFTDGVSETHALFLHSLGKTSELQYRSVLGSLSEMSESNEDNSDTGVSSISSTQRLRTLVTESREAIAATSAAPHTPLSASMRGDVLSRTRLEMLKDLGFILAPLGGQHVPRLREIASEEARWLSGSDAVPAKPFLLRNVFANFLELSVSLVVPLELDIWHITRLCVTAELLRICIAVGDSLLGEYTGAPKTLRIAQYVPLEAGVTNAHGSAAGKATNAIPQPWVDAPEVRDADLVSHLSKGNGASFLEASASSIQSLVVWAIRRLQGSRGNEDAVRRVESAAHPITITKLVAALLLPFLRKVALVFNIQYGADLAREAPWLQSDRARVSEDSTCSQVLSQSEPECVRLLRLLNLPALHQIFVPESQPMMASLAGSWLRELRVFRRRHSSPVSLGAGCTMAVPVNMPTLFSLVDLPSRFEDLFERSAKAFCPRCNGVPSDPALCLLCGTFICAQSFCCEEDGIGECNMHMKTCGGTVGIYLLVKKCGLLLLHHDNGCFMSAPYLDQHGEVDLGLKRGRPLFINRIRYEELRRLVLAQKIPIFVAHKIDQAFDIGGWVSL
ncbi:E3 ubiquitin-protein ligase ubr1 [Coemansia sp. RSA 1285]|nr:E3 ubiquitin-protein ligase ubr1 [Coemansia sp. RSA 1285]